GDEHSGRADEEIDAIQPGDDLASEYRVGDIADPRLTETVTRVGSVDRDHLGSRRMEFVGDARTHPAGRPGDERDPPPEVRTPLVDHHDDTSGASSRYSRSRCSSTMSSGIPAI